jgi:amino acid adenylation domain-containing protein
MKRTNMGELAVLANQNRKERDYWLNKLSGDLVKSSFPYDFKIKRQKGAAVYNRPNSVKFTLSNELFSRLIKLSNGEDHRLYLVLVAGIVVLLDKYTYSPSSTRDILVGAPVDKQDIDAEFINTVLVLKNRLNPDMTFKDLLLQVRQIVVEAAENANYPLELLLPDLNMSFSPGDFPLFDVAVVLENIHDKNYLMPITLNMVFSFRRLDEYIEGIVEYNSLLYKKSTLKRITSHLIRLLKEVLLNVNLRLLDIEILTEEEKGQLLFDFNDTRCNYPKNSTIQGLFEKQVERSPHHIAVVDTQTDVRQISYRHLNEKANQLAHRLKLTGVEPDAVVTIAVQRSLEMIIGMLATIKAGGAYMMADPGLPNAREKFILADSSTRWLLSQQSEACKNKEITSLFPPTHVFYLEEEQEETTFNPANVNQPLDLFYIIYTSGTTGKPKGVLIRCRGFVNLIFRHREIFNEDKTSRISQVANSSFDAMASEVWPCLLSGAALFIVGDDIRIDTFKMKQWLIHHQITISFQPTMMGEELIKEQWPEPGTALRVLRVAGDKLKQYPTHPCPFRFYNLYGPTEDTVWSTWTEVNGSSPVIGKPVGNHRIYIMSSHRQLKPLGAAGELCIAGVGLARGYLNMPELTREKFRENPFEKGKRIYHTGDLGRWLPDGNIEFLGRLDQQVKIRGNRIELGEVENCLLKHGQIKDTVVIVKTRESNPEDKFLCAYLVPLDPALSIPASQLREYLADQLPDYMIPSYFVTLEKIPLNPSGKIEPRALPEPEYTHSEAAYAPPENQIQKKLSELWADILKVEAENIGIDTNFFEIGGHSLNATIMISKVHRMFNINIPLLEVFKSPTIRGLFGYISRAKPGNYAMIPLVEKKEYYPLSSAQKRLFFTHQLEPGSINFNVVEAVVMEGPLDVPRLETVFKKLIQRHESMRTSFEILKGQLVQKVLGNQEVEFAIEHYTVEKNTPEPADSAMKEIVKNFVRPFSLGRAPLMRTALIKKNNEKHLLMVDMHHIISDGVSHQLLIREFSTLYRGEELPLLKIRYKDFTQWQQEKKEAVKKQENYWLNRFKGEIPQLNLPFDFPETGEQNFEGDIIIFQVKNEDFQKLEHLIKRNEATLYMVLLAAYNILLFKYTNQEDIVVGTAVTGRRHADLENVVGMFVNMLAMRNRPVKNKTFKKFLAEVKSNALAAYENQDYQFDELVVKLGLQGKSTGGKYPLFDVVLTLQSIDLKPLDINTSKDREHLKITPYAFEKKKMVFHLLMDAVEYKNMINIALNFPPRLFKKSTVARMTNHFQEILQQAADNEDISLADIKLSYDHVAMQTENLQEEARGDFGF